MSKNKALGVAILLRVSAHLDWSIGYDCASGKRGDDYYAAQVEARGVINDILGEWLGHKMSFVTGNFYKS